MYFYLRLGTFFGQNFFQKYRNKISYYLVNLSGLSTFHFEHHPVNYVINNIRYTTLFLILYRRQVVEDVTEYTFCLFTIDSLHEDVKPKEIILFNIMYAVRKRRRTKRMWSHMFRSSRMVSRTIPSRNRRSWRKILSPTWRSEMMDSRRIP